MPFETRQVAPRRIAVIGGGISGLGAAYYLSERHHVVLFEAERRLGGHARTITGGRHADQPVDTGFIVFNHTNYPQLTRLFADLNVPTTKSDMSFGASIDRGRIEYGLKDLQTLFAQKRNMARPAFLRMIRDILRFNARAVGAARDRGMTVGDLLEDLALGPWFRDYYLLPLSGAIWSTPTREVLSFPAWTMVKFLENHGLLGLYGQHQWYTVTGGSIVYIHRLSHAMFRRGVDLRPGTPIDAVRRTATGTEVKACGAEWEGFDEVVFATHSDDTLSLLSDASDIERRALSRVRYQPNRAVLHADTSIMPKRRACWSSWVYSEDRAHPTGRIDLTYWMNSLQPIPMSDPMFVTLNTRRPIRDELIYDEVIFRHPVYDCDVLAAQNTLHAINGQNATWFAGAWMRNGFHEDGLVSALEVVNNIDRVRMPAIAAE